MKTRSVLAFGAALSAGALLMLTLRDPQPARSQGVPAPYRAASVSLPPALVERRQEQLRSFLTAHDIKDSKVQDALTRYFGQLQKARAEVFTANRVILATLRTPPLPKAGTKPVYQPATDAQVQEAVKTFQGAVQNYETKRAEAEKDLAKTLGKEWTPRLRALLLAMGAIGEPSPIVPTWGAYNAQPDPQVLTQDTRGQDEKTTQSPTSFDAIKKIQKANADACCGGQQTDVKPADEKRPRPSAPSNAAHSGH